MANRNQDDLDRVLDAALAKYAAEPRAGLEERVLANLRAEAARGTVRAWWQWSVLAALAAVAVIAVALSWRTGSHPTTPVAVTRPTTQSRQVAGSGEQSGVRLPAERGTRKTPKHHAEAVVMVAAPPKLDQFPSPQPLSEQEKLLRAFVAENPERAVLIARARSEQLRQDQLEEMKAFPSGNERMERNGDTAER